MFKRFFALLTVTFLCFQAQAADYNIKGSPQYQAPTLRGSIGLRYWYSQNNSELDTGDLNWNTVDGVSSHTAEIVGELEDLTTSTFVRGYVGLGRNFGGEGDFYTNPSGDLEESALGYVVVDGGWRFASFANEMVRLKGFVGYHYLNDSIDAEDGRTVIEQTRQWHAIRVGLTAEGDISERVSWSFDVAAVPWSHTRVETWESQWTHGVETDLMLNLDLTRNWQVGVGGRYWWLQSNFDRRWVSDGSKAVFEQNYQRYGLLLESRYLF
ncbi:MAG: hypothetical protein RIE06_24430 [Roseibium album]|uniref:hypothetical protein n=1 Tax=Roseibium album TaxID=311410 RepID=UPI000CF13091|nr:hypothetical protein [Roseibium album]MBG6147482.1 hypothetical protein [Labrenzia sp. EL_142]MBG6178416.1 hypothetical protein [Labrenzia sp. EL_132]MBG6205139.1 hypothetical protein [Labrenzia sp. EL_13]MBG6233007.1 hypothetical protein [Labrenzia sp. EL_208]